MQILYLITPGDLIDWGLWDIFYARFREYVPGLKLEDPHRKPALKRISFILNEHTILQYMPELKEIVDIGTTIIEADYSNGRHPNAEPPICVTAVLVLPPGNLFHAGEINHPDPVDVGEDYMKEHIPTPNPDDIPQFPTSPEDWEKILK